MSNNKDYRAENAISLIEDYIGRNTTTEWFEIKNILVDMKNLIKDNPEAMVDALDECIEHLEEKMRLIYICPECGGKIKTVTRAVDDYYWACEKCGENYDL